jgi:hypothetical protein
LPKVAKPGTGTGHVMGAGMGGTGVGGTEGDRGRSGGGSTPAAPERGRQGLFVEALNHTDVSDTKRLQTLTNLSRVLLKAVGTPPTFLVHSDRREPSPAAGHLLRVYPPLTPEVEALLEAEPPANGDLQPPPPADSPLQEPIALDAGDGLAGNAASFLPPREPSAPGSALSPHAPGRTTAVTASPQVIAAAGTPVGRMPSIPESPEWEQALEQVLNRTRTGPSPVDEYWDRLLAAVDPTPPEHPAPETPAPTAAPPAADPAPRTPAALTDAAASTAHPHASTPEPLLTPAAAYQRNRSHAS